MLPAAAAAAKSLQSCPTLCDPIDGSPLDSSVPGILQARILEWVAIAFSVIFTKWVLKPCPHKYVQMDIYRCLMHNCHNLDGTKMSFSR